MKKKSIKKAVLLGAALAAAGTAGVSGFVYKRYYAKPVYDGEEDPDYLLPSGPQYDIYKEQNLEQIARLKARPFEEHRITSFDGLKLYGRWYFQGSEAPTAVLMHGYHGTALKDFLGGANELLDMGFNVLLPDQRGHMNSEGQSVCLGINERFDCRDWAWYAYERLQTPIFKGEGRFEKPGIYLYGISMGAATVLMASSLSLPPNVRGIVADCPYSSPVDMIKLIGKGMNLPEQLSVPMARASARLRAGFDPGAASPAAEAAKSDIPMLIIHGGDDRLVPCDMSREIAEAAQNCRLEIFPGAGHGLSYRVDRDRYVELIKEFTKQTTSPAFCKTENA